MSKSKSKNEPERQRYAVTVEIVVVAKDKWEAMRMVEGALFDVVRNPNEMAKVLMGVKEKGELGTGVEPVPTGLVSDGPPELN